MTMGWGALGEQVMISEPVVPCYINNKNNRQGFNPTDHWVLMWRTHDIQIFRKIHWIVIFYIMGENSASWLCQTIWPCWEHQKVKSRSKSSLRDPSSNDEPACCKSTVISIEDRVCLSHKLIHTPHLLYEQEISPLNEQKRNGSSFRREESDHSSLPNDRGQKSCNKLWFRQTKRLMTY